MTRLKTELPLLNFEMLVVIVAVDLNACIKSGSAGRQHASPTSSLACAQFIERTSHHLRVSQDESSAKAASAAGRHSELHAKSRKKSSRSPSSKHQTRVLQLGLQKW